MTGLCMNESQYDPKKIAEQINVAGFAILEKYVNAHDLKLAQDFVLAAVEKNGGECIIFRGPKEEMAGTFMYDLPINPNFAKLCRDIYEAGTGNKAPQSDCYQVLRCLTGSLGQKNSMHFHFDTYVLAALIPIMIPSEGAAGDFLILPNARPVRKFYVSSLVDKAILASRLKQKSLMTMYANNDRRLVRVKLTPGNLYFFWGYKSAHTNEECDMDKIRSTALFHYVDPHASSRLNNIAPTSRLKSIVRRAASGLRRTRRG
jgi:hypothetical protein